MTCERSIYGPIFQNVQYKIDNMTAIRDKDVQLWFWRQVILFGFYLLFEPDDSAFNQVQPCWTLVKFDNILLNLPKLKRMSNICSSPSYTRVDFSKKKISENLTHILGIQGTSEMKNFFIVFFCISKFLSYISAEHPCFSISL